MAEKLGTGPTNVGPEERVDEHGNVFRPGGWATIYSLPLPDGGRQVVDPPIFLPPFEGSRTGEEMGERQLPQAVAGIEQAEPPIVHQSPSHEA